MSAFFEILSWAAMAALLVTSLPQLILNYKRKSTEGVSWLMFGLLFFGMAVLSLRSWFFTEDLVIRLNYTLGALIVLAVNLQFLCYRILKRTPR